MTIRPWARSHEYFCGAPVRIAPSIESKSSARVNDARPTAKIEIAMPEPPVPPKPKRRVGQTTAKMKLTSAKIT